MSLLLSRNTGGIAFPARFRLDVDWDDGGDSFDAGEDITSDASMIETRRDALSWWNKQASAGRLTATLTNNAIDDEM